MDHAIGCKWSVNVEEKLTKLQALKWVKIYQEKLANFEFLHQNSSCLMNVNLLMARNSSSPWIDFNFARNWMKFWWTKFQRGEDARNVYGMEKKKEKFFLIISLHMATLYMVGGFVFILMAWKISKKPSNLSCLAFKSFSKILINFHIAIKNNSHAKHVLPPI